VGPRVFVAASVESQKLVDAVIRGLENDAKLVPWYNAFPVGPNNIDNLTSELQKCEFGIFVFAPDSSAKTREGDYLNARGNVIFEAGLCVGIHGKSHTFIIAPRNLPSIPLASDVLGITTATYDPSQAKEDPSNAMAPALSRLREALRLAPSTTSPALPTRPVAPPPTPSEKPRSATCAIPTSVSLQIPPSTVQSWFQVLAYASSNKIVSPRYSLQVCLELANHGPEDLVLEVGGFEYSVSEPSCRPAEMKESIYKYSFFEEDDTRIPVNYECRLRPHSTVKAWIPIDRKIGMDGLRLRLSKFLVGTFRVGIKASASSWHKLLWQCDI
jgi:hypothetical protein